MKHREYDIKFFKNLAVGKKGKCLSESYTKLSNKLEWKCEKNHTFSLEPSKILSRNYWCPTCTNRSYKHTIESIQSKVESRGWKFLSPTFNTVMEKYLFRCDKGHEVKMLACNVLKGGGCRTCAGKQLLTIEDFKKIAESKGGVCLSDSYIDRFTALKFKCKDGHEWEAKPSDIKNSGTWCKKCAGLDKGSIEEMQNLAISRGGLCLSSEYKNSSSKLEWQCADKHKWKATPRDVKNNDSWCPYCSWYKQESKCRYILEYFLDVKFEKTRQILPSKLELDGYSKEKKIAFEYNGEQHYNGAHYFNSTSQKSLKIIENDQKKMDECAKLGITLIVISYKNSSSDKQLIDFISKELDKHNIKRRKNSTDLLKNFYKNHSSILEIQKILEKDGAVLLSNHYENYDTQLEIKCKNNHIWKTTRYRLNRRAQCKECNGYTIKTLKDMQEIAHKRGGKCLSEKYINTNTELEWQCKSGHEWKAKPSSIMKGTWCKICAHKQKLTINDMKVIAMKRGGKCLSSTYVNNSTPLFWQCKFGHSWTARPQDIKNKKSWCPVCSGRLKQSIL